MDEKDKLKLDNLQNDKKIFWAIFVILTGGLASTLMSLNHFSFSFNFIVKLLLLFFGFFVWYFLLVRLMKVSERINEYLR